MSALAKGSSATRRRARRLAQLDKELRTREAAAPQAEKHYRESVQVKRQAEVKAQENQRWLAEAVARKAAAETAEQRAREVIKSSEEAGREGARRTGPCQSAAVAKPV